MSKPQQTNAAINFNYDVHVKELVDRFNRLIKQLGPNNRKDWKASPPVESPRYMFEVDFTYAMREVNDCPIYLQGKMFEQAASVVNALVGHLKQIQKPHNDESLEPQEA